MGCLVGVLLWPAKAEHPDERDVDILLDLGLPQRRRDHAFGTQLFQKPVDGDGVELHLDR